MAHVSRPVRPGSDRRRPEWSDRRTPHRQPLDDEGPVPERLQAAGVHLVLAGERDRAPAKVAAPSERSCDLQVAAAFLKLVMSLFTFVSLRVWTHVANVFPFFPAHAVLADDTAVFPVGVNREMQIPNALELVVLPNVSANVCAPSVVRRFVHALTASPRPLVKAVPRAF